ncbi:MAG: integrase family protein, partial [Flavipsychrobacter sp.]|nr:integrase family protein [Flavipsychrobacter sp.]
IKVLLWSKANKEGLFPIAIRIIKDRKPSYIYIGQYIKKDQWDAEEHKVKKSHPNSGRINKLILHKMAEYNDKSIDLQVDKNDTTSVAIKKSLKGNAAVTFKAQAKIYLDNLKTARKYNRISAEEPRVNRFTEFLSGADIALKDITPPLLNKYKAYLKGTRKINDRTIINHLVVIRSIYNQAKKGRLIDSKYYPFGADGIQIKFPDSIKIGLVPEEIKALEDKDLSDARQNHARNVWLFSFYFAGMRVSDVFRLTWSEMQDGRLYYAMGKNGKVDSLKIPAKALAIIDQYRGDKDDTDLVFPELKSLTNLDDQYFVQMRIKTKVAAINKSLKDVKKACSITKPLTMHIPRHSFGNISGEKISIQMLQKLYRHTHLTTTIGYQANFIHKDADDALDAVIGK